MAEMPDETTPPGSRMDPAAESGSVATPPGHDLAALIHDDELVDRAVARAQAEAVRRHRLLGQPVVVWRDGRVVVEMPGEEGSSAAG